jgi:hypothetical protein
LEEVQKKKANQLILIKRYQMKTSFTRISIVLLLVITAIACSKKSETASSENTNANEWPEMDSFHMIMAEAYHPFKDSANVEPAKKLAKEMADEAVKWQAASVPEKVNNDEVKALLVKLKDDSRVLSEGVSADMTDEEIGKALTALHDEFHAVMEKWHGEKH